MPRPAVRTLRIGTRTSRLARWQSAHIASALRRLAPGITSEEVPVVTEGDRLLDRPLPEIGGKGVFTELLEQKLREGEIDLAVHSLKDLPTQEAAGLTIAAICFRDDPRDVLIGKASTLHGLPRQARVGTSSTRRSAQLKACRPDLELRPLRGNVDTRVRKVGAGEYDAIVLAAAGVLRLGLKDVITGYLTMDEMLPAPGQGALAVQCRSDDAATLALLGELDSPEVRAAVTAERSFLRALGGGCSAPVAAFADISAKSGKLHLRGRVIAPDGTHQIHVEGQVSPPEAADLGGRLAAEALASGAGEMLK